MVRNVICEPASIAASKQCCCIAGSVQDTHDDQLSLGEGIVNRVIAVKLNAQTGRQFMASWSDLRIVQKRFKPVRDLGNEVGGALRRICRDIGAYLGKILLCSLGYSEAPF